MSKGSWKRPVAVSHAQYSENYDRIFAKKEVICKVHKPDWGTVRHVPEMPGVVDIWCSVCGQSGSFSVLEGDINWEEA